MRSANSHGLEPTDTVARTATPPAADLAHRLSCRPRMRVTSQASARGWYWVRSSCSQPVACSSVTSDSGSGDAMAFQ